MSRDPALTDLVRDARLETVLHADHTTEHTRYQHGSRSRHRRQERWRRDRLLGQGAFGTVFLEHRVHDDDRTGAVPIVLRAVKEIKKYVVVGEELDYARELEAIFKFSHRNYAHCFVVADGWFDKDDAICIVMEYLALGDLQKHIDTTPLPESCARLIASQVLEGLDFMHSNNFVHRDLKPSNIMVKSPGPDWWVKIADFGLSKRRHEDFTTLHTMNRGTMGYAAPEILGLQAGAASYTFAVDMWSLGAVVYKLVTCQAAFPDLLRLFQFVSGLQDFPSAPLESNGLSRDGCDFVAALLAPAYESRPTAQSAQHHLWLRSVNSASRGDASDKSQPPNRYQSPYIESIPDESSTLTYTNLSPDSKVLLRTPSPTIRSVPEHVYTRQAEEKATLGPDERGDASSARMVLEDIPDVRDIPTLINRAEDLSLSQPSDSDTEIRPMAREIVLPCGHTRTDPWIRAALLDAVANPAKMPPRCCVDSPLSTTLIALSSLPPAFEYQFRQKWNEYTRHQIQCPNEDCSGEVFLSPDTCHKVDRGHIIDLIITCQNCRTRICGDCKRPIHQQDCRIDRGTRLLLADMRLPIFVDMAPEVMQANMSYVPEPPWLLNSARIPSSSRTEDEDSHEDSGSDMAGEDYHSDSVEFITFSSDYCDSCWGNLPGEPLQKLDCEHFICDRCVVGIIILGLFSPRFSRPRCCDRSVRTKHFERVELLPHDLLTMWYSHREDADLATWTCPSGHVVHDLRLTDSDISIWEARIDCLQCPSSRATYCRRCRDPRCGNGEECRDFAYLREQVRRLYRDVILTRGGSSSIKAKLEICVETERMLRLEPSAHDFIPFKRSESTTFDLDLEAASTEFNREMRLIQNLTWASDYIRRSSVVSRRPKLGP